MAELSLPPKAESALNRLQDTQLSPMEEALYQGWLKANKIEDPDNPDDFIDYRGIYAGTNGAVKPNGELARETSKKNDQMTIEKALQERMMQRMEELIGKKEDESMMLHKEERQDITHQQKMEQGEQKLKHAPFDLQMKEKDLAAKKMDLQKQHVSLEGQRLGLEGQRLGNEGQVLGNKGKELDLISSLMQPSQPTSMPSKSKDRA